MAEVLGIAAVFGFFGAVVAGLYVMGKRIRTGDGRPSRASSARSRRFGIQPPTGPG